MQTFNNNQLYHIELSAYSMDGVVDNHFTSGTIFHVDGIPVSNKAIYDKYTCYPSTYSITGAMSCIRLAIENIKKYDNKYVKNVLVGIMYECSYQNTNLEEDDEPILYENDKYWSEDGIFAYTMEFFLTDDPEKAIKKLKFYDVSDEMSISHEDNNFDDIDTFYYTQPYF